MCEYPDSKVVLSEGTKRALVDTLQWRVQQELGIALTPENLSATVMELDFKS